MLLDSALPLTRKPKEGEEDPTLIEEINQAKLNMGDFKRKIHPDYQSQQTIRPTEKAAELNQLLARIHRMKCEFNEKVFVIKEEKVEVTGRLEQLTKKLVDIQVREGHSIHINVLQFAR